MKNILILLCLYFFSVSYSQSSAIAIYKVNVDGSTLGITEDDNEQALNTKKMLSKALNKAKEFKYQLKFNENESLYMLQEFMNSDALNDSYFYNIAKSITGKGVFYQNKEKDLVLEQTSVMGSRYLISSTLFTNWKITKESKKIGKYLCYKAIRSCETCPNKESEFVWFTPEIPFPYGPLGYGGLPGLILEVNKGLLVTIQLESLKFNNKEICIEKPKKGKEITLEEFNKLTKEIRAKAKEF